MVCTENYDLLEDTILHMSSLQYLCGYLQKMVIIVYFAPPFIHSKL